MSGGAYVNKWEWQLYQPVKPPRSGQSSVQHAGSISGSNHDHARVILEAVHLRQQRIQRIGVFCAPQNQVNLVA